MEGSRARNMHPHFVKELNLFNKSLFKLNLEELGKNRVLYTHLPYLKCIFMQIFK
jgi:hypothetical protein